MQNLPDENEKINFFNKNSSFWEENFDENEKGKIERLLEMCRFHEGESILEAGCGVGNVTVGLCRMIPKGSILAMDYSREMVTRARRKQFPDMVKFLVGDVNKVPYSNKSFSTVLCFNSFPHFTNKQGAINEFHRLLRDNGRLFIIHSISRDQINHLHSKVGGPIAIDKLPHPSHIHIMMNYAGFEKVRVDDAQDYFFLEYRKPEQVPFVF